MAPKKNRILIFGGTGFIGHHLSLKCAELGWDVTSVSKNFPRKNKILKKVKYINMNLEDTKNLKKINKDFDYLVNAAGYINNNDSLKYKNHNLKITKNIFTHFKETNIKAFLSVGSSAEYGGRNSKKNENFLCIPKSKYGKDKLNCTDFLIKVFKKFNFPSIVFRVYQVYGPKQETNRLIPIVAKACFHGKTFNCSDPKLIRDFIYIDDLVNAILKALKNNNAKGQIFNLGSGKGVSLKYLVSSIRNYYKKGHPLFGKIKLRKDESKIIIANIAKSKKILDWKPNYTFKSGLSKTLKYYNSVFKS